MDIIDLNEVLKKSAGAITFLAVDKTAPRAVREGRMIFFPNSLEARKYRLSDKNSIWLDDLADPDCKKCMGTGKTGTSILSKEVPVSEIQKLLEENLDKPEVDLAFEIIKLLGLFPDYAGPINILLDHIRGELTEDNSKELAEKYATVMKRDLVIKVPQWCTCFVAKLKEKIEDIERRLKFSIN